MGAFFPRSTTDRTHRHRRALAQDPRYNLERWLVLQTVYNGWYPCVSLSAYFENNMTTAFIGNCFLFACVFDG